jgi:hypothetical protein
MNVDTVTVGPRPEVNAMPLKEVACIFCGLPTPLPASGPGGSASHVAPRISIVRCLVCGKEAPYRACDVFEPGEYGSRVSDSSVLAGIAFADAT